MLLESETYLLQRRHEITRLRNQYFLHLLKERDHLRQDKRNLKEKIKEIEQRSDRITVTTLEKVETIYVDRIEYVPKVEFITLYEKLQIQNELRKKIQEYLALDEKAQINVEATLTNLHAQLLKQEEMINHLTGWRNNAVRKRKRFAVVAGFGGGITARGHGYIGLQVTAGYVIK
jgi:hypothetical protein